MKIAHLASFTGNIGDVANHESFYKILKDKLTSNIVIEQIEIRDFYNNVQIKKFDQEFVNHINKHDLFVFGGGNFFELCWDYSENGTTFNIKNELLKQIKVPILINGMGIDDNKGISGENIEKFRVFLTTLFNDTNVYFSVRNDGSYDIFNKYFPEFTHKIKEIPDFGFLLGEVGMFKNNQQHRKYPCIGINIAKDMDNIRYSSMSYKEFILGMSDFISYVIDNTDYYITMFPHIQSDYEIIMEVLHLVNHKDKRKRINIAGLVQSKELDTFLYYNDCDIVFATRFHSNVGAIALNIPTFGIITYPKHGIMYDKIKLTNRKETIANKNIFTRMKSEIDLCKNNNHLKDIKEEYSKVLKEIKEQTNTYMENLKEWLG